MVVQWFNIGRAWWMTHNLSAKQLLVDFYSSSQFFYQAGSFINYNVVQCRNNTINDT